MSKSRWSVRLEGDAFDLEDAREAFGKNTSIQVAEINVRDVTITALIADEFNGYDDAAAVNEAAERLLALINGYLFARDATRKPVRAGAIYRRDADDQWGPATLA